MLKNITLLSAAALLCSQFTGCRQNDTVNNTNSRPNVILIMTDDQGIGDIGFNGNHFIKTPNLDNLAKESVRLTNFYVCPVCAPTRSSLMTGRYSMRTGIRGTNNGDATMAANEVTIAEVLKETGYKTSIFGKWHLGDNYPTRPMDQGFDESLIHLAGGMGQPGDYLNYWDKDTSYFDPVLMHNGKPQAYEGYCSDVYVDEAVKYIKENSGSPFFMYLAFNAPHTPLQVPVEYYNMYKDIDPSTGFEEKGGVQNMSEEDKEDARKVYGMVTNIDYNVGRVLKSLQDNNIDKNTMVIFLTDNGHQQRRYAKGLRGRKTEVYQGDIKVPCFIKYPGNFPNNKEIDITTANFDIPVMIAEVCGTKFPGDRIIDGKSLLPVINGQDNGDYFKNRPLFFHWTRRGITKYHNMAVIKDGYKLVMQSEYYEPVDSFQLYDLKNDPAEKYNLIAGKTELAKSLKNEIDAWYDEVSKSPNAVNPPVSIIGTKHENPVVLNRNDTKGPEDVWRHQESAGYWDVKIAEKGYYNVKFKFIQPLDNSGTMKLQLGPTLYTISNKETGIDELEMKNIYLPEYEGMLKPWYFFRGRSYLPFTVEIEKIGE